MDVASPTDLLAPVSSIASNLGTIMETMLGSPSSPEPSEGSNDTTNGDPCKSIAPIDKANADKPGVVEYETDIGDSGSYMYLLQDIILIHFQF